MSFKALLTIFSVVAMGDGVLAILAPGPFVNFIWRQRAWPEANLFVQGWGACLMALSLAAWAGRSLTDTVARRWLALSLLAYNLVVAVVWLLDAMSYGWTPLSLFTFAALLPLAGGFGYFRFVKLAKQS
jgi:hypothetical protein